MIWSIVCSETGLCCAIQGKFDGPEWLCKLSTVRLHLLIFNYTCILTIPGNTISMTRNSGLPFGGSLSILYLGVEAFEFELTSDSSILHFGELAPKNK